MEWLLKTSWLNCGFVKRYCANLSKLNLMTPMKTVKLLFATLIFALCYSNVNAQQTNETQRQISLEECIEMALKHNLDIQIERLNPAIQRSILESSYGVYDPLLTLGYNRIGFNNPGDYQQTWWGPLKQRAGEREYNDYLYSTVEGKLPFGTYYSIPIEYNRSFGSDTLWDTYTGIIGIELRQPLLKGAMIDEERWTIMVEKKNLKMTEQFLQFQIMYIISLVEQAYYELIYAKENVRVQETALAFAERLYKDNLAKVKAGALIPRDEKFAESEVAMRKADILEAMHLVTLQESILKNLMTDDLENWKNVRLIPAAPLIAVPQKFDIQESWRLGLSQRPDIMQLKTSVQISDLDIRFYKNQKLPDVSLVGRYGHNALSTKAENMFADSWSPRYPDYMYGVEVVFPWSNREVKAKLRQSKEMREQAELMVKKLEQEVMVQIQDAISFAKTSYDRIDATRQSRIAAEIAVAVEEKKYQNGASTAYLVLEYQNNLVMARLAEVRALVDYNIALSTLAFGEGTILDKLKIKIDFE